MDLRLPNWRRVLSFSLLFGASASVLAAQEQPAAANASKFKVLVLALEKRADASGNFGKDVAEELRKLIERMPRHEPIDKKVVQDAFRKFNLKENEMDCVKNRQLAVSLDAELVMCGSFSGANNNFRVDSIKFINAKSQEAFEVPAVSAANAKEASSKIHAEFEKFVNFIERLAYCYQYLDSQQWAQAIENCDHALAVNPNSPRANMGKAFALYSQAGTGEQTDMAKLRESLALYKKVLELNLEQEALRTAGIIAARLQLHDESRQYFKQYLELNPGDAAVRLTIAHEQSKAGDKEGALRVVEEGLKTDSANIDLLTWAGIYAAQAAYDLHKQAMDAAQPGTPVVIPQNAKTLYETAVTYYNKLYTIKQADFEPTIAEQLIRTLVVLERHNDAIEVGRRLAGSKAYTTVVKAALAGALANAGQTAEAIRIFDEAIAAGDTAAASMKLRARKADILVRSGDLEAAKTALRDAVAGGELTADEAANQLWQIGAADKFSKNDNDGALAHFEASAELAQSSMQKAKASYWQGLVWQKKAQTFGQPAKAAEAKVALPAWQRALRHMEEGEEFGRSDARYDYPRTIGVVKQYIDYLQQVIKRGI
jgi:tetratricopeptide (TPR) repeat protein